MQEEFQIFGDALVASLRNLNAITAVVFGGSANIPARNDMRGPGATSGGGFKDEHVGARRRERNFGEMKINVALVLGIGARVGVRGTKQV